MMGNCNWIGFGGWIFSFLFFGFGLLGAFILLYKDITLAPKYKNIFRKKMGLLQNGLANILLLGGVIILGIKIFIIPILIKIPLYWYCLISN